MFVPALLGAGSFQGNPVPRDFEYSPHPTSDVRVLDSETLVFTCHYKFAVPLNCKKGKCNTLNFFSLQQV